MGDNSGWGYMQATLINLYDAKRLSPTALDAVMRVYKDSDIDHGGNDDELRAKDGLTLEQIVWKVHHPRKAVPAVLPEDDVDRWDGELEVFWDKLRNKYHWG